MASIKHENTSSVVRHMLSDLKVRGSILSQAVLSFCCDVRIYTGFYSETTSENTSSKHERYTRNGANRISSLTQVLYTCFRAFELVFCTLVTRDIVYWEVIVHSCTNKSKLPIHHRKKCIRMVLCFVH